MQQLESDHGSEGPCVHGASDWSECGHVSERAIASEDQAGLARE